MSVGTINNNTAQLYTQERPVTASLKQQNNQAATAPVPAGDSVQISERARALLQQENLSEADATSLSSTQAETPGNGAGIEPPK
ncbi:hypothetical protein GCM10027181_35550 [Rheinheimera gaetbuli]